MEGRKYSGNMIRKITTLLSKHYLQIMESLIKETLLEFLKNTNALSDRQFGFLLGKSTALQLLNVLDKWTEALDNGTSTTSKFIKSPSIL